MTNKWWDQYNLFILNNTQELSENDCKSICFKVQYLLSSTCVSTF